MLCLQYRHTQTLRLSPKILVKMLSPFRSSPSCTSPTTQYKFDHGYRIVPPFRGLAAHDSPSPVVSGYQLAHYIGKRCEDQLSGLLRFEDMDYSITLLLMQVLFTPN